MGRNCCSWKVARPVQAANLITNPSIEGVTIASTGSTVTTTNVDYIPSQALIETYAAAAFGNQSLKVTENVFGLVPYGVIFRLKELETATQYVFSFHIKSLVKNPETLLLTVEAKSDDNVRTLGYTSLNLKKGWNRVFIPFGAEDPTPITRIIVKVQQQYNGEAYLIDGLQLTKGAGRHTYFDGNTNGTWRGAQNDSISDRDIYTPGGQIVDICELGFWPTSWGVGLPELDLGEREFALRGGALSDRTLVKTKSFNITGTVYGDQHRIHEVRQKLLEIFVPSNSQSRSTPSLLWYTVLDDCCNKFGCELEVQATFAGEPAFVMDNFDQADMVLPFKDLEAPNIYEPGYRSQVLSYRVDDGGTPPSVVSDYFIRQATGGWIVRNEAAFSAVTRATAVAPSPTTLGDAWFGSQGNSPNVFLAGVNTAANYGMSGVLAETDVTDITVAANGNVWFVGTGAAKLWYRKPDATTVDRSSAFTTPTKIAISQNFVYVGATNQTGGIVRRSANDGASWVSLAAVATGEVRDMAVQPDGKVVVVGSFTNTTNINKTAVNAMRYNPRTFAWEAICTSADAAIDAVAVGPDGRIYLGGKFTTLNGVACNQIAVWNGSQISPLGSGVGAPATFDAADGKSIKALVVASDGTLWCGGRFDTAGGNPAVNLAKWQGGTWTPSDLSFNNRPVNALAIDKAGSLFVAATVSGGSDVPDIEYANQICYCGTADEKPTLTLYGPGTLKSIKHLITGARVEFDYTMAEGEIMVLDFARNDSDLFASSQNGNQLRAIRPTSNLDRFALIATPGQCENGANNPIALLIEGGVTGTTKAVLQWRNRHWSIDAAANCGRCDGETL